MLEHGKCCAENKTGAWDGITGAENNDGGGLRRAAWDQCQYSAVAPTLPGAVTDKREVVW